MRTGLISIKDKRVECLWQREGLKVHPRNPGRASFGSATDPVSVSSQNIVPCARRSARQPSQLALRPPPTSPF